MRSFEKWVLLQTLDGKWIDHLQSIDMLREGIGLRGYGQKDPVRSSSSRKPTRCSRGSSRIMEETARLLFKLEVRQNHEEPEEQEVPAMLSEPEEGPPVIPGRRRGAKLSRNQDCWCGSGKMWKVCHYPEEG